ncbi:MAG: glycosyltransferase family 25 protein [Pseudomonadota bacterium]
MADGSTIIHNAARSDVAGVTAFVINLDKDHERFDWVAGQLRRVGIDMRRVPAALGADLPEPVLARHRRDGERVLSPAEVGCIESHILAAKTLIESGLPYALIVEDDVHVSAGAAEMVRELATHLDTFPIIKLEATPMGIDVDTRCIEVGRYCLAALRSAQLGTAAYLVSRAGAEIIAARLSHTAMPADFALFSPPYDEFRVGQVMPGLFQQDGFTENPTFPSLMGERETGMRGDRGMLFRMIYPLLVAGYNFLNLPKGRKRVKIQFQP